ncbi:hypothetical protein HPB47_020642 [Ixodes persulcatus]|uniref:Uncharacterized protein n=1 Tax=Ixodes persulcatus TaxID=34615 RepID=A0AC60QEX3_IXOPE|nr:hypothetical protein HPB47_020642 [Ixodes persulcatus]
MHRKHLAAAGNKAASVPPGDETSLTPRSWEVPHVADTPRRQPRCMRTPPGICPSPIGADGFPKEEEGEGVYRLACPNSAERPDCSPITADGLPIEKPLIGCDHSSVAAAVRVRWIQYENWALKRRLQDAENYYEQQVIVALQFYAMGNLLITARDYIRVHVYTASRTVRRQEIRSLQLLLPFCFLQEPL